MAGLPEVPLPTTKVEIGGVHVEITSLSRSQQMRIANLSNEDKIDEAEIALLAYAAGVTEAEAEAWRETTQAGVVGELVEAICEFSGMTDGAQKSGGT